MSRTELATLARFGLIGVLATGTHLIVVTFLALATGMPAIAANTTGFLIAFGVSGIGHAAYTFRLRSGRRKAIAKWFIVSAFGLIASNLALGAMIRAELAPEFWLRVGAIAVVPAASYVAARLWAFVDG